MGNDRLALTARATPNAKPRLVVDDDGNEITLAVARKLPAYKDHTFNREIVVANNVLCQELEIDIAGTKEKKRITNTIDTPTIANKTQIHGLHKEAISAKGAGVRSTVSGKWTGKVRTKSETNAPDGTVAFDPTLKSDWLAWRDTVCNSSTPIDTLASNDDEVLGYIRNIVDTLSHVLANNESPGHVDDGPNFGKGDASTLGKKVAVN